MTDSPEQEQEEERPPDRRAVVMGVSEFPASRLDTEVPAPGELALDPLGFVPERMEALTAQLKWSGYAVSRVPEPGRTAMIESVRGCIGDDSCACRIIHVISHGVSRRKGRVDAVPSDGDVRFSDTDVVTWISDSWQGPPTLFLIDLCFAGEALDQKWLDETDAGARAVHVIAAATAGRPAFNGHFTTALAEVLGQCSVTGLGTDSSCRYVDLAAFARVVQDETDKQSSSAQRVAFTSMRGTRTAELPFFDNPNYAGDRPLDRIRTAVHPDLLPFLEDPAAGAGFWADRVGRHFTGREAQLDAVMPWIRGGAGPALRVVTGGPGSGKSTLLGAVVCASHPILHALDAAARADGSTRPDIVRAAGEYEPEPVVPFASIHARQRRLGDIVASIGRQLVLPVPDGGWSAPELVAAVARMSDPPSIVVDALDESVEAENVEAVLLLPLARCLEETGGRLLVGVRPWREVFRDLFDTASQPAALIDLDLVEQEVLRADLEGFVRGILDDSPRFQGPGLTGPRTQLARGVAKRLSQLPRGAHETGAFLVAGLFARHLGAGGPDSRPPVIAELLANIPTSLPEVLELDLRGRAEPGTLRATLAALALARGEGIPWEQVHRLLESMDYDVHPGRPPQEIQFYLRMSLDVGERRTTLYRLFHQSLVDYLTEHPLRPPGAEAS